MRYVFGVPSGPVLPLIEALRREPGIDFVLTASETSAGFMAEATGRLTGVPGVCVSTVGPGATNLATGVGGAWLDRSPLIAITCTYAERWLTRRTQMRIDHQALFAPITKAQLRLGRGAVAGTLAEALRIARGEPPGPVHIELPEDVGTAEADRLLDETAGALPDAAPPPPGGLGERVLALLRRAHRPLVVTGLTFTRARHPHALLRFIETQHLPFVTTLHAKGFLPESHAGCLGVMGRARRTDVQRMMDSADLLVCVGFDPVETNYEEWCGSTPVAHLSTERADVDGSVRLAYEGVGDLDAIIAQLATLPAVPNAWREAEWTAHRASLERALRPPLAPAVPSELEGSKAEGAPGMAAYHVLDVLRARLPADAVLACDVGAHTHQIATQWRTDLPHTALATNGWSSMGYGVPAAYAAKLARPERTVVGVVGDGGFQMTVGELATARRLGLRVPVIVLNDGWLGLMKVKQERLGLPYEGAFLGEQVGPPAHYFGVPVRAARDERSLRAALDWALALDGPSVIEAFIDVEPYSTTVYDV